MTITCSRCSGPDSLHRTASLLVPWSVSGAIEGRGLVEHQLHDCYGPGRRHFRVSAVPMIRHECDACLPDTQLCAAPPGAITRIGKQICDALWVTWDQDSYAGNNHGTVRGPSVFV